MSVIKSFYTQSISKITMRFSNKLIIIISLFMLMIIFIIAFLSYYFNSRTLNSLWIMQQKSSMELVSQSFSDYMEELEDYSIDIRKDNSVVDILEKNLNNLDNQQTISDELTQTYFSRDFMKDIDEIDLYLPRIDMHYSISANKLVTLTSYEQGDMQYLKVKSLTSQNNFFAVLPPEPQTVNTADMEFALLERTIINIPDQSALAYVIVHVNSNYIKKLLNKLDVNKGSITLLLYNGSPFYSTDNRTAGIINIANASLPHDGVVKTSSIGKNYYLFRKTVSTTPGWQIISAIPADPILYTLRFERNTTIIISILIWLMSIPVCIFFINHTTGRLIKLTDAMKKFGKGYFNESFNIKGNDEIARLAQTFQQMSLDLKQLINEEYNLKIKKQNSDYEALKAKLNPHFLYNSLQVISTQALISDAKEVSKMIDTLAATFRYCIKGPDMVTVEEELVNTKNYILLYKARFGDRFQVNIAVEKASLEIAIPKLLINELIENCMKHAVEKTYDTVHISIDIKLDNKLLYIIITDDGPGITPLKLEDINSSFYEKEQIITPEDSIGLRNLSSRIKIVYGEDSTFRVDSKQGDGTKITVIFRPNNKT
jgi:two-component system sensor histidine kinase YesM